MINRRKLLLTVAGAAALPLVGIAAQPSLPQGRKWLPPNHALFPMPWQADSVFRFINLEEKPFGIAFLVTPEMWKEPVLTGRKVGVSLKEDWVLHAWEGEHGILKRIEIHTANPWFPEIRLPLFGRDDTRSMFQFGGTVTFAWPDPLITLEC